MTSEAFERSADELADLARSFRWRSPAPARAEQLAERLGCRFLADDPVSAAASVAAGTGTR